MHSHILPLGPQHPALEESVYIKLHVNGEEIMDVDLNLGYEHKGVEKSFENREWAKGTFLASRICGICNHQHATAYAQGVEELLGVKVPKRSRYIRTILLELERIQSHILWAGVAAHEIGFDTLFQYCWKTREHALDCVELITGKRVQYDTNIIGGSRHDVKKEDAPKVLENLRLLEEELPRYAKSFLNDRSIKARTRGVGILKKKTVQDFSAVGPTARASGVDFDIRKIDPYQAYGELKFKVILDEGEDCRARVVVRLKEIGESVSIIKQAIAKLPSGPIAAKAPCFQVPPGEAISRVEAPRGELFYYIKSIGGTNPDRVKVRTPTYSNFAVLREMLVGETIADAPIIVASIDPCICCTDRMEVFDVKKEESKIMSGHELARMKEV